jgi:hypothetical protein
MNKPLGRKPRSDVTADRRVVIRLTPEESERLRSYAVRAGLSMSERLRLAETRLEDEDDLTAALREDRRQGWRAKWIEYQARKQERLDLAAANDDANEALRRG